MDEYVVETLDGQWIIEGDVRTDDFDVVIAHYQRSSTPPEQESESSGFRSTAFCAYPDREMDAVWNPAQKLAITYCFNTSWDDVPELQGIAEQLLTQATLAWESAADINFVQLPGGEGCSHENGVLYEVIYNPHDLDDPDDVHGLYGLASFPGPDLLGEYDNHSLNFYTRTFAENATLPVDFVFVHELGHMLGLYHEVARFPQGTIACIFAAGANNWWRGLTAPDPSSVMGYPQCYGTSPMAPYPSALDRTGLGFLYNLPRPVLAGPLGVDSGTLVWHRPSTSDYVVWEPIGGGSQPLSFAETVGCYEPACAMVESSEHWKPLLYRNGASVDVLMYGPGSYEERRITSIDGVAVSDAPGTIETKTDVPIILDRFFAANDRSVWWIRPGAPSDSLWRDLDESAQLTPGYDAQPFTDEHYSPVVGRLFDNASSVFWLSPTSEDAYLVYLNNGVYTQVTVNKVSCRPAPI